jgi:hypothetical protein
MHNFNRFRAENIVFGAALLFALSANPVLAASPSDIRITPDGRFSATNVVVFQKAGTSNFFSRVTWGNAYVRVTVLAQKDTVIIKAHGEQASVDDIREKDVLDVEGILSSGEGALVINATKIRDNSLQVESKTLSGTVVSVNPEQSVFVLSNTKFGADTTVTLSSSTTIQKGVRNISLSDISKGDKILSMSGSYDYSKNSFSATLIEVYQDKSVFLPRNFEGTLRSISSRALPATLILGVGNTDYTVYLAEGSSILNSRRKPASLTRFVAGDKVRIYGNIRQANLGEIDAEVVRDLNF